MGQNELVQHHNTEQYHAPSTSPSICIREHRYYQYNPIKINNFFIHKADQCLDVNINKVLYLSALRIIKNSNIDI